MTETTTQQLEWRTVVRFPNDGVLIYEDHQTRAEADAWATLERADYPHAEVWVESREVSPWRRAS